MIETPDMSVEIARRTRACWMRIRRYLRELCDQPKVALSLKTRMVKAEAIEALLYGCSTWILRQEHYAKLRIVHHRVLLRVIGAQRKRRDHRVTSYNRALEITRNETIETTLRTRRLLWAGALIRMSGGRLPKRVVFGNLEGAVRRGRGGKEKEWTDCVQGDTRTFGIAGGWKATALEPGVWVETVTEGGRRFMAAWRKEDVDAARHRQEKREATRLEKLLSHTERDNETGKIVIAHGSVELSEATRIGLVDESKKSYTDARTETCVAPRHVDASRDFYFILSERAAWGGACAARVSLLFSFSSSADLERDWRPCKVVFRVGNQYAECEKKQKNMYIPLPPLPVLSLTPHAVTNVRYTVL